MLYSVYLEGWRIALVKRGRKWVFVMPIGGVPKVSRFSTKTKLLMEETEADPRKVVEMLRKKELRGRGRALLEELETSVKQSPRNQDVQ